MVLFTGYHATAQRNRASIREFGLLADYNADDYGVFVFDPHMLNAPGSTAQQCGWDSGPGQDLWKVTYCGPMLKDPCLVNAVILPSVTDVTLVTGNE